MNKDLSKGLLIGIALGLIIATVLLLIQQQYGIISMDLGTAGLSALPVKFATSDYLMVIIFSYVVTFLSVILPLRKLKNDLQIYQNGIPCNLAKKRTHHFSNFSRSYPRVLFLLLRIF